MSSVQVLSKNPSWTMKDLHEKSYAYRWQTVHTLGLNATVVRSWNFLAFCHENAEELPKTTPRIVVIMCNHTLKSNHRQVADHSSLGVNEALHTWQKRKLIILWSLVSCKSIWINHHNVHVFHRNAPRMHGTNQMQKNRLKCPKSWLIVGS